MLIGWVGMGADESSGGPVFAIEVQARTDDLAQFFRTGAVYVSHLESLFDEVVLARSAVLRALGSAEGTPPISVAKPDYSGNFDPFAELIAEARSANGFVKVIHDALTNGTALNGVSTAPVSTVNLAIRASGLQLSGEDLSLSEDQAIAAAATTEAQRDEVRLELEAILAAGIEDDGSGLGPHELIGSGLHDVATALAAESPERAALVGEVMVEYGLGLQADLDPSGEGYYHLQPAATMLVTEGAARIPGSRLGELVDELAGLRITTADGRPRSSLEILVDALDLDQEGFALSDIAIGPSFQDWPGDSQLYFRQLALDRLIRSTIGPDGELSRGGQGLVDYTLDTHPGVVEASDDLRLLPVGRRWETADRFNLRTTLATALAAPNHGLTDSDYRIAQQIDEIDAELLGELSADEFDWLWFRRRELVSQLADHDEAASRLIIDAMARGLSGPEAARLVAHAATQGETDARVRRLRLVYETTAFGDPVAVDKLVTLDVPIEIARSLMVELGVLQTIQEARFNDGLPAPDVPLSPAQVELVGRYEEYVTWVHHFGNGWALGQRQALQQIADGEAAIVHDLPDGLRELAVELSSGENHTIWELLSGASDNDIFLGPDGGYRPAGGRDHVGTDDPQALRVQMALVAKLGPHQRMLDLAGDGVVHEDEVARWLQENDNDAAIPPALLDRVRFGQRFGVGQDTLGWDEIGELIGWVGLGAAATATIVYSGGTAVPLWVQAGLVGLAGLEAFAFVQADDPFNAAVAGFGGLADLATAARLLRTARLPAAGHITVGSVTDQTAELLELAGRSDLPAIRELAKQAEDLRPTEFRSRYEAILTVQGDRLAQHLTTDGFPPARVAQLIAEVDPTPPLAPGRIGHAIDGNINGAGRASGGHYARSPNVQVVTRSAPDVNGVTTGTINIWDPERVSWVGKRGSQHTFFPEWWTRRQTELAIDDVFTNSSPLVTRDRTKLDQQGRPLFWRGRSFDGVLLEGRYRNPADPSAGWLSVFPIFEG